VDKYCENCGEPYEEHELENGICISCADKMDFDFDFDEEDITDKDIKEAENRIDSPNLMDAFNG
jgi:hypothetical protein